MIGSLGELEGFAREALAAAEPPAARATVFALSDKLGAGKTAFVQALGRALGVEERIASPTFLVMKRYDVPQGERFDALVHVDAYRVEDPAELAVLGFADVLASPRTLICIEWPERVASLLPAAGIMRFTFTLEPDGTRTITYA